MPPASVCVNGFAYGPTFNASSNSWSYSCKVCTDVAQTPVACSTAAGTYGIPAGATAGNASWTKNSCSGAITYTGGCSVPAAAPAPAITPSPTPLPSGASPAPAPTAPTAPTCRATANGNGGGTYVCTDNTSYFVVGNAFNNAAGIPNGLTTSQMNSAIVNGGYNTIPSMSCGDGPGTNGSGVQSCYSLFSGGGA
jgi:hypothetical protein